MAINKVDEQQEEIAELYDLQDRLEQYTRKNSLEIHGIPEEALPPLPKKFRVETVLVEKFASILEYISFVRTDLSHCTVKLKSWQGNHLQVYSMPERVSE